MDNLLQGEFEISIKDENTLVERFNKRYKNNITNSFINRIVNYSDSISFPTLIEERGSIFLSNISISTNTIDYGRSILFLDGFIATAITNVANAGPYISIIPSTANTDYIIEIRQRLGSTESLYGVGNGYSRTFKTIALTKLSSSIDHCGSQANYPANSLSTQAMAYVVLDTPCTQNATEIIDFVYRLRVPFDSVFLDYAKDVGDTITSNTPFTNHNTGGSTPTNRSPNGRLYVGTHMPSLSNIPSSNYTRPTFYNRGTHFQASASSSSSTIDKLLRKVTFTSTLLSTNTSFLGRIVRSIYTGQYSNSYSARNITFNSVFKSLFSHSANATLPFQDANNLATGSIKPNLDGTWSGLNGNSFPELYMFKLITGGVIGTSTYKIYKRKTTGFNGNVYNQVASYLGSMPVQADNSIYLPHNNFHLEPNGKCRFVKYSERKILCWDKNGITLFQVLNGEYKSYDTNNFDLDAIDIRQCTVDTTTGIVYIACASTGLWSVDPDNDTVTQIKNLPCHGVDYGTKVYALFNNSGSAELYNSDNWNTSLAFTFAASNLYSSTYDSVFFIKADPNPSPSGGLDRLALCGVRSAGELAIWWWASDSSTVSAGPVNNNWIDFYGGIAANSIWTTNTYNALAFQFSNPNILVCSVDSRWYISVRVLYPFSGTYVYLYSFNFASTTALTNYISGGIANTGNTTYDGHIFPRLINGKYVVAKNYLMDSTDVTVNSSTQDSFLLGSINTDNTLYGGSIELEKGVFYSPNTVFTPLPSFITTAGVTTAANTVGAIPNPLAWDYYSWDNINSTWVLDTPTWNGTNWVVPSTAAKPTHTTVDNLIGIDDGLTLAWEELGSSGGVINEYYTQVVCEGEIKDMTNNLSFSSTWYGAPTETINLSSTSIPNSAPYSLLIPESPYGGTSPISTFTAMEHVDTTKMSFSISGYSNPAIIRTNPTDVLGLNEVLINPVTGTLIFNSGDAGKTVTGSYLIVKGDTSRAIPTNTLPNPLNKINSPTLILRGELGVTLVSSKVSEWLDTSSGYNRLFQQTNSSNRPSMTVKGSIDVMRFTRANVEYLDLATASNGLFNFDKGFTIFLIYKPNSVGINACILNLFNPKINDTGNSERYNTGLYLEQNSSNQLSLYLRGYNYTWFSPQIRSSSAFLTNNTWSLISLTYYRSDNTLVFRNNGSTLTTATAAFNPENAIFNCRIGAPLEATPSTSNAINADIAFLGIYNQLTIPEVKLVEDELNSIYTVY
ncbi:hypothetical protein H6G33_09350 [Calothrix sp. FACHB-1219]|uniref:hypothetical protein n=1 Tax=unclassified Calothrix TaxID=2619626 RepID=UPI001688FF11|nr:MULTISPECIES: hypothetical protein [unclassified Calothrix]MBD2201551.1 hypothetical protein [Calothrix sp. FACHB-168]MBD2217237.1 hypothetical protein [Calothrix sp. FACHB-1219]